jgi:polar amino acid transport system substrate-binding protein
MRRSRYVVWTVVLSALVLVAVACSNGSSGGSGASSAAPTAQPTDALSAVMASGTLRVSTDPNYAPQSFYDQSTGKWQGFDIDVATEIAKRMGLQIEWKTPNWNNITSGHWADRWDVSVGSMTVTPERAKVLDFTTPYYYTPASYAVNKDNTTITGVNDLNGKKIGVCGSCTYEAYLQHKLKIPGETINFQVDNAQIVSYSTDAVAIKDLELGDGVRLDAVISALPTLQEAVKKGEPIKIIGEPLYYEPLAAAIDKSSDLDPTSLVDKVSSVIQQMHEDGTLTQLSKKWYGQDLTTETKA